MMHGPIYIRITSYLSNRQFISYIPYDTWISEIRSTAMIHSTYFIVNVEDMWLKFDFKSS